MSLKAAAAAFNVAPATAHRWWHRWRSAGQAERIIQSYSSSFRVASIPDLAPLAMGENVLPEIRGCLGGHVRGGRPWDQPSKPRPRNSQSSFRSRLVSSRHSCGLCSQT